FRADRYFGDALGGRDRVGQRAGGPAWPDVIGSSGGQGDRERGGRERRFGHVRGGERHGDSFAREHDHGLAWSGKDTSNARFITRKRQHQRDRFWNSARRHVRGDGRVVKLYACLSGRRRYGRGRGG